MNLFDCTDAVRICHYFRLERLVFLQALHLVLNVSDVLEAFCLRNLQFVFNPALRLTAHHVQTVSAPYYTDCKQTVR